MANEAAGVPQYGIASRASDIDVRMTWHTGSPASRSANPNQSKSVSASCEEFSFLEEKRDSATGPTLVSHSARRGVSFLVAYRASQILVNYRVR